MDTENAARFGLRLPTSVLPPVLQALNTLDLRAPTVEGKPGSGLTPDTVSKFVLPYAAGLADGLGRTTKQSELGFQ